MGILESLNISVFMMAVVFVVLCGLFLLINLFSLIIRSIESKSKDDVKTTKRQ
ncbi:OadG family transporter subunit [Scatolibacter rhodanostii]|uniref:OadG family transporter subunit n=1 Tax=Scatolibacter rhodanostii TaxID=2014781 RepID=UPI0013562DEF|nr:OadG family transporter subunit [Scatolibacter rhodanostii]